MNVKTFITGLCAAAMAATVFAEDPSINERQALFGAVAKVQAAMKKADAIPATETVAILPLKGDKDSEALNLLNTAITDAGKKCVIGKEDPVVDEILKEIAWDERKLDIIDAATADKFGSLKSAQILLYGEVTKTKTDESILVELELHATRIKTKEHIWGGVFDQRYYRSKDVRGISELPGSVRALLREQMTDRIAKSIAAQPKLTNLVNVAIVPLSGDDDKYVTFIVRDAIGRTKITSRDLDTESRAETLGILRARPQSADAYLFGAVRDLGLFLIEEGAADNGNGSSASLFVKHYIAKAEVQLCIEDPITRDQLWSDTIYVDPIPVDKTVDAYGNDVPPEPLPPFDEITIQALEKAVEKAEVAFRNADGLSGRQTIAVLPICHDRPAFAGTRCDAVRSRVKMALTKAGKDCVEDRKDPVFNRLCEEIDWDSQSKKILDGSTIDRFGSIKAANILVYGSVHTNKLDNGMYVEIELHAMEVATKKHLWGDVFTQRYYIPNHTGPVYQDIKTMPLDARKDIHDQVVRQMAESIAAKGLGQKIKAVVLVPPVGDDEGYGWTIMKDALSKAGITWREYDVRTRGEALAALRDRPQEADALLWGNLIGYKAEEDSKIKVSDFYSVTSNVYFEIQVNIEKAGDRDAVWSDTLRAKTQVSKDIKIIDTDDHPTISINKIIRFAGMAVIAIVVLCVIGSLIKAATRVR